MVNGIFTFVKFGSYIAGILSLHFVVNFASLIVEEAEPTATGVINTLATMSTGMFYLGIAFTTILVYWYFQDSLLALAKSLRSR